VTRAVDARADDVALRVARPHEEAGGGVIDAAAALDRACGRRGIEDVAVDDLDVEARERRGIGGARIIARTRSPRATSSRQMLLPTWPLAPVTRVGFMIPPCSNGSDFVP
jgi:hypothetical protein